MLVMAMERLAVLSQRDEKCYMEVRFVCRHYRDGGISMHRIGRANKYKSLEPSVAGSLLNKQI